MTGQRLSLALSPSPTPSFNVGWVDAREACLALATPVSLGLLYRAESVPGLIGTPSEQTLDELKGTPSIDLPKIDTDDGPHPVMI